MSYSIEFGEPKHVKTTKGNKFYTVPIYRKVANGEKGRLTFVTDKCFSWGPQKNKKNSGKIDYKLPICMISKDKTGRLVMTEKEKEFFEWTTLMKQLS